MIDLTAAQKRELLAQLIQDRAAASVRSAAAPAFVETTGDRHEPFPLTDIQHAYWVGRMRVFDLGNVGTYVYLEFETAALDPDLMNMAWQRVIDRHDMLRTVVTADGRQQTLSSVPPYEIQFIDLRGMDAAQAEQIRMANREQNSHRVFPVEQWPLFDLKVFQCDGDRFHHCIGIDLIIADLMSLQIMLDEWFTLYADPSAELEPLTVTFRDYVLAERASHGSRAYERARSYWWDRLADLPPAPALPMARDPRSLERYRFERRTHRLDAPTWQRLKATAREHGLTPASVLLAAFGEVVAAWSASRRFTVNLTLFNRQQLHPQINRVVGDFTSTNLLAVDATEQKTFAERAHAVQAQIWSDLDHREVSGVRVMREIGRRFGWQRASMPVIFTCDLAPGSATNLDADTFSIPLPFEREYGISQTPQVFLDHQVFEEAGSLLVNWDAVEDLFPAGLLDAMFDANRALLVRLADDEASWREPAPCLTPDEQLDRRRAANDTDVDVAEQMLHGPFLDQAARAPHAPAVVTVDRTLTYAELDAFSDRVAGWLRDHGARPNTLVAVSMDKGWEQVVALVGVVRSGAAYVPIDPELPTRRVWDLLADSEASLILTQPWLDANLEWPPGHVRLAVDEAQLAGLSPAGVREDRGDDVPSWHDLAYVIYTSGSTGQPKGVEISHRGAVNTILDVNRRFGVGQTDSVLALSNVNFDLSVYDVFGMLAAGGTIVVPPPAAKRDPREWARLVREHRVTVWNTVPALAHLLVDALDTTADQALGCLRVVLLSGDWIPLTLPDRLRDHGSDMAVISLGGATEASIWSITFPIGDVEREWKSIPYGRPMANQTMHVLDGNLDPRPDWVPGDLYIGGAGVALGYWRDPQRTASSFLDDPRGGGRLYRTGDVGRYLPDGNIEFLGREDSQVKISGHRIELGEIEKTLEQHPGISAAVVTALGEDRSHKRLAGFVVADPDAVSDPDDAGALFTTDIARPDVVRASTAAFAAASRRAGELPPPMSTTGEFLSLLDDVSARYMLDALAALGLFTEPGRPHTLEAVRAAGVSPHHAPLVESWLGKLVDIGALAHGADGWSSIGSRRAYGGTAAWDELEDRAGVIAGGGRLFDLLRRFGDNLPGVLTGATDPLEIFFAEGSEEAAEALYKLNPTADYLNDVLNEALTAFVASVPDQHIDVLEVGAGTGGTTASLLPGLRGRAAYRYTDVSRFFLNRAAEKFADFDFLTYEIFDMDREPLRDGFDAHSIHVIVAANVLHNARDLGATLHHLRTLLVPGGLLSLIELTERSMVEMVTISLLHGATADDEPAREGIGLRGRDEWDAALREAGYEQPSFFPTDAGHAQAIGAHAIVARTPERTRAFDRRAVVDFLRDRLPDYMVPAEFHLLAELPLNSNGKVDRDALSAPTRPVANVDSPYVAPRDATEQLLAEMWVEALGVPRVGVHDNFFDLGGDSLVAIELLAQAATRGIELDPADVFEHQTIAELARLATDPAGASAERALVVELRGGTSRPLFCVHPSTGGIECYMTLATRLAGDQSVYGLRAAARAEGDIGTVDIVALAATYVDAVRAVQPDGPYRLLGWSVGGVIAFEMACQLVTAGERVELLAILDQGINASADPSATEAEFVLGQLAAAGLQVPAGGDDLGDEEQLRRVFSTLGEPALPADASPDLFAQYVDVVRANFDALRRYVPGRFPGDLVFFGAAHSLPGADIGWRRVAGSVTVVELAGTHFQLLQEPAVDVVAAELSARLAQ